MGKSKSQRWSSGGSLMSLFSSRSSLELGEDFLREAGNLPKPVNARADNSSQQQFPRAGGSSGRNASSTNTLSVLPEDRETGVPHARPNGKHVSLQRESRSDGNKNKQPESLNSTARKSLLAQFLNKLLPSWILDDEVGAENDKIAATLQTTPPPAKPPMEDFVRKCSTPESLYTAAELRRASSKNRDLDLGESSKNVLTRTSSSRTSTSTKYSSRTKRTSSTRSVNTTKQLVETSKSRTNSRASFSIFATDETDEFSQTNPFTESGKTLFTKDEERSIRLAARNDYERTDSSNSLLRRRRSSAVPPVVGVTLEIFANPKKDIDENFEYNSFDISGLFYQAESSSN